MRTARQRQLRKPRFEQLEIRKLLSAARGANSPGGRVSGTGQRQRRLAEFNSSHLSRGRHPGTQLTQIVINGDKDHNGKYSSGEVFFDTAPGGQGVFASAPLKIVQSNGFTVNSTQVVDGGQQIVFNLSGFVAGDKLIFSIDVDEVQYVDPTTGQIDENAVVEGDEFQRSILTGSFTAPHFQNTSGNALFWDEFDQNFADANASSSTTLDLPNDSYEPPATTDQTDLTAGAVLVLPQTPLPISLSGTVYHDQNLSNSLDPGEQGIAGVTLTLLEFDNGQWQPTGQTTVTDANGNYKFDGLPPGTYQVAETQPAGWVSVGSQVGTAEGGVDGTSVDPDHLSNIVLLGGDDGVHYNFGEARPASISGRVWNDVNGDCVYQAGQDLPLGGVQIDLLNNQGDVVGTTTTDVQGDYEFDNLVPGTYSVFEHQPAGYDQGMDMLGTVNGVTVGEHNTDNLLSDVTLGSGAAGIHYDFCEYIPASISGRVWNDVNGDCIYEPETDLPLAGVVIDLRNQQGQVVATTTTDVQGDYEFDDLEPGVYSVFEHQPAGYDEGMDMVGTVGGVTDGENGGVDLLSNITLASGAVGIHYDFCEYIPASVSGRVWNDVNGDCIYEPDTDLPLAGVQIDLLNQQGQVVATTTTDVQGDYEFDDLDPGVYSVFEHQPAGYDQGMDMLGTVGGVTDGEHNTENLLSNVTLNSGAVGIHYDFCEYIPASISGRVWNDVNGDCVYEPDTDLPLAGVQIDLRDSQGQVVATTTTDVQGNYEFDDLDPGVYSVFEHQPAGYDEGMDMVGTVGGVTDGEHGGVDLLSNVTLNSGAVGIHYDFCEYIPASISGRVWNDVNGDCVYEPDTDLPLAGVQIDLRNSQGQVVATTTTDVQGNYEFDDLDPGVYSVFEHQPAGYDEGMDMVGTVGGVTDGEHGGVDLLSNVTLNSGAVGIHFDFCEYIPASISGRVWNDVNGDCVYQPDIDKPLAGVQIDLRNQQGQVVATTTTDALGDYKFDDLDPGVYSVFEHQPAGYAEGMDMLGTVNGVTDGEHLAIDLLSNVTLNSGASASATTSAKFSPPAFPATCFRMGRRLFCHLAKPSRTWPPSATASAPATTSRLPA